MTTISLFPATPTSATSAAPVDSSPVTPAVARPASRKAPNAFRTISETADELQVPQHVLRFWETKFPQLRPIKRGGGRRYYRPEDLDLLRRISSLLYVEGYTIKAVQRLLREGGDGAATPDGDDTQPMLDLPATADPAVPVGIPPDVRVALVAMLQALEDWRSALKPR